MLIIDKFSEEPEKAIFYIRETVKNGWSGDVLRNFIDTDFIFSAKKEETTPTIGLLICRDKNNLIAQYALEASNLPLGISEYELSKIYPEKLEGTIPTIDELEKELEKMENKVGS